MEEKWFSYNTLTTSKEGIKWKIYLNKYIKSIKSWKGCKPKEFEYLIDLKTGEVKNVRNVMILSDIFSNNEDNDNHCHYSGLPSVKAYNNK